MMVVVVMMYNEKARIEIPCGWRENNNHKPYSGEEVRQ